MRIRLSDGKSQLNSLSGKAEINGIVNHSKGVVKGGVVARLKDNIQCPKGLVKISGLKEQVRGQCVESEEL